jgi:hypothetical protein
MIERHRAQYVQPDEDAPGRCVNTGPGDLIAPGGDPMPNPAIPEPGSVTLPRWAVESLRKRLARCMDESLTAEQRHEERLMLVGALDYHLSDPQ